MYAVTIQREDITFSATFDDYPALCLWVEHEAANLTRANAIRRVSVWEDSELIEAPEIQHLVEVYAPED